MTSFRWTHSPRLSRALRSAWCRCGDPIGVAPGAGRSTTDPVLYEAGPARDIIANQDCGVYSRRVHLGVSCVRNVQGRAGRRTLGGGECLRQNALSVVDDGRAVPVVVGILSPANSAPCASGNLAIANGLNDDGQLIPAWKVRLQDTIDYVHYTCPGRILSSVRELPSGFQREATRSCQPGFSSAYGGQDPTSE